MDYKADSSQGSIYDNMTHEIEVDIQDVYSVIEKQQLVLDRFEYEIRAGLLIEFDVLANTKLANTVRNTLHICRKHTTDERRLLEGPMNIIHHSSLMPFHWEPEQDELESMPDEEIDQMDLAHSIGYRRFFNTMVAYNNIQIKLEQVTASIETFQCKIQVGRLIQFHNVLRTSKTCRLKRMLFRLPRESRLMAKGTTVKTTAAKTHPQCKTHAYKSKLQKVRSLQQITAREIELSKKLQHPRNSEYRSIQDVKNCPDTMAYARKATIITNRTSIYLALRFFTRSRTKHHAVNGYFHSTTSAKADQHTLLALTIVCAQLTIYANHLARTPARNTSPKIDFPAMNNDKAIQYVTQSRPERKPIRQTTDPGRPAHPG